MIHGVEFSNKIWGNNFKFFLEYLIRIKIQRFDNRNSAFADKNSAFPPSQYNDKNLVLSQKRAGPTNT